MRLTEKQRRFVEAYMGNANGNATQAASLAGYRGNRATLASIARENLRKPQIRAAIDVRVERDPAISDREARQRFWTSVLQDTAQRMTDRLRASELLGKSQGDFVNNSGTNASEPACRAVVYFPDNGRGPLPTTEP